MMASSKRKAVTEERPAKKLKSKAEETTDRTKSTPSSQSTSLVARQAPVKNTILGNIFKEDERAFPRGGANVLTPIEQKQIKAQAEHDVLQEQQSGIDRDGLFDPGATSSRKQSKRKKNDGHSSHTASTREIKIHSLGYKVLTPGSIVLGRITSITTRDVALALPNNLTGFIPITAISDALNNRIDQILNVDNSDGSDSRDDDIDLHNLFDIGQWLRAVVVSTDSKAQASEKHGKRHIELSVNPRLVNPPLNADEIVPNCVLNASVRSIEDHGIVVDLGLPDVDMKGFISKKELGSAWKMNNLEDGQVMMCLVTGKGTSGKVLKLSPDPGRFSISGGGSDVPLLDDVRNVAALTPGSAVSVLVTASATHGIRGTVMGLHDVTADLFHSTLASTAAEQKPKFKVGDKIKVRIIFALSRDDGSHSIGFSCLGSLLSLPPPIARLAPNASAKQRKESAALENSLSISSIIEVAKVTHVESERGLFLDLAPGSDVPVIGFAHISQIADKRIESLSQSQGLYKTGSTHKLRITSYNPVDDLFYVSMKESVLIQPFLRLEDVRIGEKVKGTVERLILGGKTGIMGVVVKLSDNITCLVPEVHLSDTALQNPDRKFREGSSVIGRILSVDIDKRQIRATLKKSLVATDQAESIWKDYNGLEANMTSKGTVINLLSTGAVIQYFGDVRAWLPVSEMSESFVDTPSTHLRLGQTVDTRIVSIDAGAKEMKVSCKSDKPLDDQQTTVWHTITGGEVVSGEVTVKTAGSVTLDLDNGLSGVLNYSHMVEGGTEKAERAANKLHVGQRFSNLIVLGKNRRGNFLILSHKKSLVQSAQAGPLLRSFEDVVEGLKVHGFVRNLTVDGIYVEFVNSLVGFVPRRLVPSEMAAKVSFGLVKDQTVHAWVSAVDAGQQRFTLSMRPQLANDVDAIDQLQSTQLIHAIDPALTNMHDLTPGLVTRARVTSTKSTQLNVQLADNVQGRIDVSEVFDSWAEVANKIVPLNQFSVGDIMDVKLLGLHDTRNHRFLPLSHRQSSNRVLELSAKRSRVEAHNDALLSLDTVEVGNKYVGFVNNHGADCIWVNLSPSVRGRIAFMDLTDDIGIFQHLGKVHPIGSAMEVVVKKVDTALERLDLVADAAKNSSGLKLEDISPGMVLPARITKLTERSVHVQLSDNLSAPIPFVELSDDYDNIGLETFQRNDIVRVCVIDVEQAQKRLYLSLRPSKTLSSSLPIADPQITHASQLQVGEIVRGFVKNISDNGVYVSLGNRVDAFIRVRDLTDQYVKDWKTIVALDQLVKGRVLRIDETAKHILLSLRASHVDNNYKPPLSLTDLSVGMIVTGRVRKVEDFGAFIDLDNTQPRLSGLCHRSEVAEQRVEDVRKIYQEGDVVKAIVLQVDQGSRKISLGLKASYFLNQNEDDEHQDVDDGSDSNAESTDHQEQRNSPLDDVVPDETLQGDEHEYSPAEDFDQHYGVRVTHNEGSGLQTDGFDWTGANNNTADHLTTSDVDSDDTTKLSKRKSAKPEIKEDLTGSIDEFGPRSASDFERQLLAQPNHSELWIRYMAFQLQLGEVQKGRDIATRALNAIHIQETEEKTNIWIAYLNLEVEYGDDEQVANVFQEACRMQDPLHMHEKLASIYIAANRYPQAQALFDKTIQNKAFRASPEVWVNYASFLTNNMSNVQNARALLSKALQSVPSSEHRQLSAKFAALEFRSTNGDPERGRTIFESLLTEWPKWSSGWDMWIDLEQSRIKHLNSDLKREAREQTRSLYERVATQAMKRRRAKFFFKKWLDFEEREGSKKDVEHVKAAATEFVSRNQE